MKSSIFCDIKPTIRFYYQQTTQHYIPEERSLLTNPFILPNIKQHNCTLINTKIGEIYGYREWTGGIENCGHQANDTFTDADIPEFVEYFS
jgi:hypothetical protein